VDIHGVAKAKSVPVSHLETVLTDGAGFAGFAICGVGIEPHGPDFMAKGDLGTVSLVPWQPGLARIVCEGHVDGEPWVYDSRVVLKKQVARLAERGLTMFTGLEPEFSLLRRTDDGGIAPCDPSDTLHKPCYDYKGLSRTRAYLETLANVMRATGIDVYQIDHEDANGQFELNYTYTDCLTSCDHFVFFKMAASELAKEHGLGSAPSCPSLLPTGRAMACTCTCLWAMASATCFATRPIPRGWSSRRWPTSSWPAC